MTEAFKRGYMDKLAGLSDADLSPDELRSLRRVWGMPESGDDEALARRKRVKRRNGAVLAALGALGGGLAGGATIPSLYEGKFTTSGSGAAAGAAAGLLASLVAAYAANSNESKKARKEIASGKKLPKHEAI